MNDGTSSFERGSRPVGRPRRGAGVGASQKGASDRDPSAESRVGSSARSAGPTRFSADPESGRGSRSASFRAPAASRPYSTGCEQEVLPRAELLEERASTLTRLIRRLTAISSRSMSWPKTSTRPSSRVRRPETRRDERGLARAVGAEDPDRCHRARGGATRSRSRAPACACGRPMKRLVTFSTRRAGTARSRVAAAAMLPSVRAIFCCPIRVCGHLSDSRVAARQAGRLVWWRVGGGSDPGWTSNEPRIQFDASGARVGPRLGGAS